MSDQTISAELLSACARAVFALANAGKTTHEIWASSHSGGVAATSKSDGEFELGELLAAEAARCFSRWRDWDAVDLEGMEHFEACILDETDREFVRRKLTALCDEGEYADIQQGWNECWGKSVCCIQQNWILVLSLASEVSQREMMTPQELLSWWCAR